MPHQPLDLSYYNKYKLTTGQLVYFGLWLIIPFCSFTSHTIVPVPPTMVIFFLASVMLMFFARGAYITMEFIFPLLVIGYLCVTQTMIGAPLTRYLGVIFAIGYFMVVVAFGRQLSLDDYRVLGHKFITYSTVLLVVECMWRLTHPNLDYAEFAASGDPRWIYQYKFGGLMYVDSNATGIHIMILLFFIYYLESDWGEEWKKTKIVLLILLILTFSRAAWAGVALGWVYVRFLRGKSLQFYLMNFVVLTLLAALVYRFYLAKKIESDLSFQSKIEIVYIVSNYFSKAQFHELLFGIGFSNSLPRMGIYAHNFFMVFLIESGIIGLTLMIIMLIWFGVITRGRAYVIVVPFIITTLSSTITFIPYFYVVMGLLFLMEYKREPKETVL